jgi:hypothetical protein
MLEKICEYCQTKFTLPNHTQKYLKRRFCGPVCSRRWAANNRSDCWKQKASLAKQGENNPMFGVSQTNPNSLSNLIRTAWTGKKQPIEANKKRSNKLTGIKRSQETINKTRQTKIDKGIFGNPMIPNMLNSKNIAEKFIIGQARTT